MGRMPWFGRRRNLLVAGLVATVVVVVGGLAGVYAVFFGGSAPRQLGLSATPSTSASATANSSSTARPGAWTVVSGSQAGYRVREQLAFVGAPSDAVGRTDAISGSMTVAQTGGGYQVTAASFTVDVSKLTSDRPMRDQRIRRIGLESDRYPTANFRLTSPISLPSNAASGQAFTVQATGDLTVHGTTRRVTIPLQARLTGSRIEVAGSITFPFSEFGMTPPSIPGFVSVQDNATMEFNLLLQKS